MHETTAFLDALLADWPGWGLLGEPTIIWSEQGVGEHTVRIVDHIESLPAVTSARRST